MLAIRARPRARAPEVRWDPWRRTWIVAVTAPAVAGAANRAIVTFLAERLGLRAEAVRLLRGETSDSKTVEIRGISEEEVHRRLSAGADSARRPV